jgi:tetratricopeptide (TPR) repeat protein
VGTILVGLGSGCASPSRTPAARETQARYQFNLAVRQYHVPAGDATNALDRAALQDKAAQEYQRLAREYADVPRWAASSLCSLGQIYIDRGQIKEGLTCFEQVGQRYPMEHWEVIQAWKSAADCLWDNRNRGEALLYYRQIVNTYGNQPGQPPMFDTIVGIARSRLKDVETP